MASLSVMVQTEDSFLVSDLVDGESSEFARRGEETLTVLRTSGAGDEASSPPHFLGGGSQGSVDRLAARGSPAFAAIPRGATLPPQPFHKKLKNTKDAAAKAVFLKLWSGDVVAKWSLLGNASGIRVAVEPTVPGTTTSSERRFSGEELLVIEFDLHKPEHARFTAEIKNEEFAALLHENVKADLAPRVFHHFLRSCGACAMVNPDILSQAVEALKVTYKGKHQEWNGWAAAVLDLAMIRCDLVLNYVSDAKILLIRDSLTKVAEALEISNQCETAAIIYQFATDHYCPDMKEKAMWQGFAAIAWRRHGKLSESEEAYIRTLFYQCQSNNSKLDLNEENTELLFGNMQQMYESKLQARSRENGMAGITSTEEDYVWCAFWALLHVAKWKPINGEVLEFTRGGILQVGRQNEELLKSEYQTRKAALRALTSVAQSMTKSKFYAFLNGCCRRNAQIFVPFPDMERDTGPQGNSMKAIAPEGGRSLADYVLNRCGNKACSKADELHAADALKNCRACKSIAYCSIGTFRVYLIRCGETSWTVIQYCFSFIFSLLITHSRVSAGGLAQPQEILQGKAEEESGNVTVNGADGSWMEVFSNN